MLTCTVHVTVAICFHWRVFTRQCKPNATKTFQCDVDGTRQSIIFWIFDFFFRFLMLLTCFVHISNKKLRVFTPVFFGFWRVSFTSKAKILWWPFFVWRVNTRQWYAFLFTDVWLHVTEASFFYWRVQYTSVHAKCEIMLLDVWLTRQWYIFFSTDVWSTRHWSEFLLLTCQPRVSAC